MIADSLDRDPKSKQLLSIGRVQQSFLNLDHQNISFKAC
jgi:hypothetical protein